MIPLEEIAKHYFRVAKNQREQGCHTADVDFCISAASALEQQWADN